MMRSSATRCLGVLAFVGMLGGCGGGGHSSAASDGGANSPLAAAHAAPTLALTAASTPEIAVQTVAVLTSLRALGYAMASELESVSPRNPTQQSPCGVGGSWSITYLDLDRSGTRTPGDQIVIAAPGCSVATFGNGRATATVLAAEDDGLVDVRIVIEGGTLPYFYEWVPTLTGTLRMTADADDLWMRSEGALVFTPGPAKSFRAMNVGLRLAPDLANNPPAPGVFGSLDIAFDTPAGAGGSITVDTQGLIAGHSVGEAPSPGALVLGGAGGSKARISDARPTNPGWFLMTTDANGDGSMEATVTLPYLGIFDRL